MLLGKEAEFVVVRWIVDVLVNVIRIIGLFVVKLLVMHLLSVVALRLDVVHLRLVHPDLLQVLRTGSLVFEHLIEHLVDVHGHLKKPIALGIRLLLG